LLTVVRQVYCTKNTSPHRQKSNSRFQL